MKFALTLAFILQLANFANAAINTRLLTSNLEAQVSEINYACAQAPCKSPYKKIKLKKIEPALQQALEEKAKDLAQIWGDTILEGDYYASGNTNLDSVVALVRDGQTFAYKITYSEKAWYTGECDYNGHEDRLIECESGRIVESAYVSSDLRSDYQDPLNYAEFKSDKE